MANLSLSSSCALRLQAFAPSSRKAQNSAKFFYGRGFWDMECSTSFSERAKGHMSELPWLGPPLSSDPPEETCREAAPALRCSGRGSSQIYHRKVCIADRLTYPSTPKRPKAPHSLFLSHTQSGQEPAPSGPSHPSPAQVAAGGLVKWTGRI